MLKTSARPARFLSAGMQRTALILSFLCLCGARLTAQAAPGRTGEVASLFREEMGKAARKMHWRGERLSDDTLYALATTGISWEIAWGREHPFSLAWGDYSRAPRLNGQTGRNDPEYLLEVSRAYGHRDFRRAVDIAEAHFTLEQIGHDPVLKEAVGQSLLSLGQSEQAFPVFASPFTPGSGAAETARANRHFREVALKAARRAGLRREVIAFSLSLLLEPGAYAPDVDADRIRQVESLGIDVDRVLLGILESPAKLHGLPAYTYAAADLLTYRASPKLLPFLSRLAESDDVYLRSRAVTALGLLAYMSRPSDPSDWSQRLLYVPLRENSVSSSERKMIDHAVKSALGSDRFRLRVAGIEAITLIGEEESIPTLQRLLKDRAYVVSAPNGDVNRARRLTFPVAAAAAAGLGRFAMRAEAGGGDLSGRAFDRARRGGKDETNDRRGLRRDVVSQFTLSPADVPVPLAEDIPSRGEPR